MLVSLACGSLACDGTGQSATATPSHDHAHEAARPEPLLPRFEGHLLNGERASTDLLARRRGLLFVYSPRASGAEDIAALVAKLRSEAEAANVRLVGIQQGGEDDGARSFRERHGLDFAVFDDDSSSIARKLPIERGSAALLLVDAQGYVIFGFSGMDPSVSKRTYESALREALHLADPASAAPAFGVRPEAPAFEVETLDGQALDSDTLEGKVRVVAFFLHTCPHCHDALQFLSRLKRKLATDELAIVPISVQRKPTVLREMAKQLDYRDALYVDPGSAAQSAYAHGGGVPDVFVIGRDGRVLGRHQGMSARIEALLTMQIRQALGVPNPLLLDRTGWSGEQACGICHTDPHATWSLTNHAYAFETLVQHGADRNPECLPCHTVGWDAGGYSLEHPAAHLEGVQCENCHGRGGPHQSPDFAKAGLAPVCESCHNKTHSLRFDFADRLPLVSHAANRAFDGLSLEERQALIERRDRRERQLFDKAHFVGSAACQSCHASESALWARQPHAHAFDTLESRGQAANPECQRCHTTGFQQDGGFPNDALDHAHVGCESCHGPGGNHVAPDAERRGTILALTDKCDSCVILQICGSCHDDANDPQFEFELADKLDRIRHGFRDRPNPHAEASPAGAAE